MLIPYLESGKKYASNGGIFIIFHGEALGFFMFFAFFTMLRPY